MRFIAYITQGDLLIARGSIMDTDAADPADVVAKGVDGVRRDGKRNNSFLSRPEDAKDEARAAQFEQLLERFGAFITEAVATRDDRLECTFAFGDTLRTYKGDVILAPSETKPMKLRVEAMSDEAVAENDRLCDVLLGRAA